MVNYRRNRQAGGTFFFTVTLRDRGANYLTVHIAALREAFRHVRCSHPFLIDAIVVLPEHLHTLWTLPEGDQDYSGRWRAIKSRFTHSLVRAGVELARDARGEYNLWQRRYWEHTIRDEDDYRHHADYIHLNPVKHGLVKRAIDWPYSSFHKYLKEGLIPADWAGNGEQKGAFGE